MLEAAGKGVAMGNADDAVKARADVVIGDNTTDSIARYIYTHLLWSGRDWDALDLRVQPEARFNA